MSAEERLQALEISLPRLATPGGLYQDVVRDGDLLFLSGKVGAEVTLEEAVEDAQQTGLNLLTALRHELGSLDRVTRIVKLFGMVNAASGFADHPSHRRLFAAHDRCLRQQRKACTFRRRHGQSAGQHDR